MRTTVRSWWSIMEAAMDARYPEAQWTQTSPAGTSSVPLGEFVQRDVDALGDVSVVVLAVLADVEHDEVVRGD